MNGAAAVLESRISVPRRSMTIRIGSSHHFLFWARNAQNSRARLSPSVSAAAFSNSLGVWGVISLIVFNSRWGLEPSAPSELPEIALRAGRCRLGGPVRFHPRAAGAMERVAAKEPEHQPDRREEPIEHQRQHDL